MVFKEHYIVTKKIDLLAIVGPTACGKTKLAIEIANKYNGEVISADSRTVYKYLDIGTAKPSKKEQATVPHWGFDLVGPGDNFNVAKYKKYANNCIKDIQFRNKLPILVGGSGLYIDSVLYDFNFATKDKGIRVKLDGLSANELQQMIKAEGLRLPQNYKNKRHLILTLERKGEIPTKKGLLKNTLVVGINTEKEVLTNRIELRSKNMIKNGVIDEFNKVNKIYPFDSEPINSGVYKVLRDSGNNISQDNLVSNIVKSDLKLVKKQMTWFKRNKDITWFKDVDMAKNWLDNYLNGRLK